jgi:hypothetical protein
MTLIYECDLCNIQSEIPLPSSFVYRWFEKSENNQVIQVQEEQSGAGTGVRNVNGDVNLCFNCARSLLKKMNRKKDKLLQ